jgi:hypothetical protein
MEPDTDKALMEIHSSPTAMVKQLCEIQHHLSSREGAWDWVQHLRLLSIRNITEGPVRQEAFLDANLPKRHTLLSRIAGAVNLMGCSTTRSRHGVQLVQVE